MTNPTRFEVIKTTTEKLQDILNSIEWSCLDTNPEIVSLEHTGGRDWVLVLRSGQARQPYTSMNITTIQSPQDFEKTLAKRRDDFRKGWLR